MSTVKTRDVVLAVIVAAGFLLFQHAAEEVDLLHGAGGILAILGLIVALGAVATFVYDKVVKSPIEVGASEVPQPVVSRFLFHDTRSAPLWLVVRFYLGFQWLEARYHQLTGSGWGEGGRPPQGYGTKG